MPCIFCLSKRQRVMQTRTQQSPNFKSGVGKRCVRYTNQDKKLPINTFLTLPCLSTSVPNIIFDPTHIEWPMHLYTNTQHHADTNIPGRPGHSACLQWLHPFAVVCQAKLHLIASIRHGDISWLVLMGLLCWLQLQPLVGFPSLSAWQGHV